MYEDKIPFKNCTMADIISMLTKINKVISSCEEEKKEAGDKTWEK